MEAAPVNIIQYFDGSKQGVIPLFQRPYSWEQKDWSTLWEDLMAQYESADRSAHFMGAVVTVPVKSVPVGVTKHLVIDGQQRLTTLSLLLAAIRDKANKDSDGPTAGIIGDFLINRHYKAPDDLKLVPTQADRSAYNSLIYQKELSPYEESRIVQAYRFFRRKLEGQDLEDQPITASQTLQAIQQSLQVVMINLGEADDPYLIFESLNHKGKPLNQADLVRNYVLMRFQHSTTAGGEQEVAYEDLWRPMETKLDGLMPEFLRHYGMRGGRNVRKGDIYTASKLELEKFKTPAEVRTKLDEMKEAAFSYEKFLHPDEEDDTRIGQRLKGILELDSTVFYPLLLRLYKLWNQKQIGAEDLLQCLDLLESFYVRRMICGVPTNALNKITLELCLNLPDTNPGAWLQERLSHGSGSRRCPTDQEFFEALVLKPIYPRRKIARYMLIALEESHQHKEPVDTTSATMEHVMPQTLSDSWKTSLGTNYVAIHDQWLDTLGNLTLTGYNSELGNASFDEKKAKLQNTHFELSRNLLARSQWTAAEIEERAKSLAEIAKKRWAMQ
jgi:uncharacterized protein with ParB-like and HNH nuclease domain